MEVYTFTFLGIEFYYCTDGTALYDTWSLAKMGVHNNNKNNRWQLFTNLNKA